MCACTVYTVCISMRGSNPRPLRRSGPRRSVETRDLLVWLRRDSLLDLLAKGRLNWVGHSRNSEWIRMLHHRSGNQSFCPVNDLGSQSIYIIRYPTCAGTFRIPGVANPVESTLAGAASSVSFEAGLIEDVRPLEGTFSLRADRSRLRVETETLVGLGVRLLASNCFSARQLLDTSSFCCGGGRSRALRRIV